MSSSRWQPGVATFIYVFAIFVLFALCKLVRVWPIRVRGRAEADTCPARAAVTQMGLSGHQLDKYGYHIDGWGGRHQLKSVIGLIMWTACLGVVFCLASFWLPAVVALVVLFVIQ